MTILQNQYVQIILHASEQLAVATWSAATEQMDEEAYKAVFMELADVFEKHQVRYWLGDAKDFRTPVTPDLQLWVALEFTPRLISSGVRKMAVVIPTEFIPSLSVEQSMEEMKEHHEEKLFDMAYFDDVSAARAWLLR